MTLEDEKYCNLMDTLAKNKKELSEEDKDQLRKIRSERSRLKILSGLAWMAKDKPEKLLAIGYTQEQIAELSAMVK